MPRESPEQPAATVIGLRAHLEVGDLETYPGSASEEQVAAGGALLVFLPVVEWRAEDGRRDAWHTGFPDRVWLPEGSGSVREALEFQVRSTAEDVVYDIRQGHAVSAAPCMTLPIRWSWNATLPSD